MKTRAGQWEQVFGLLAGAGLAFLLVRYKSKAVQDAALIGCFLYAAWRGGAAWRAWLTPGGMAALGLLLYTIVQIPFGVNPGHSFRLLSKQTDIALFLLALPCFLTNPTRLRQVILALALALTGVLWADLVRLTVLLGPRLAAEARYTEPYILTHPNIAAMGAVLAILALAYGLWEQRRRTVWVVVLGLALLINLGYLVIIGSRGPQLALLAGSGVGLWSALDRRMRRLALLCLVLAMVALPVINPRFRQAFGGGLVDRDKVWAHTVTLIAERSLLGHGYGETVFMDAYHTDAAPESPHHFYHPHQYWLNVLFVHGGIGLGLQVVMWGALAVAVLRRAMVSRDASGRAAAAVLAMLVGLHVYGLIDQPTNIVALAMLLVVPLAVAAGGQRGAP